MLSDFIENKEDLYKAKLNSDKFKEYYFSHLKYINEKYKELVLFSNHFNNNLKDIHPNLNHEDLDINNKYFSFSNVDEKGRAEFSYFNHQFEISIFKVLYRVQTLYFFIIENGEIKYRFYFDKNNKIILEFINDDNLSMTIYTLEKRIREENIIKNSTLFSERILENNEKPSFRYSSKKKKAVFKKVDILEVVVQIKDYSEYQYIEFLKFTDFKVEDIYMNEAFKSKLSVGYEVLKLRKYDELEYLNENNIIFILFNNVRQYCEEYGMRNQANESYKNDLKELQAMGVNVINPFILNETDIEMFKINKVI